MLPATRNFIEMMRENRKGDDIPSDGIAMEPAVHEDQYDPKILQLRLKRKYQLGMIKKMLEEGGYGDLAKMTTIGRKSYDIEE